MSGKTGGPAFPRPAVWLRNDRADSNFLQDEGQAGMALRDYFAAAALPGVIAARTRLSIANLLDDLNQESIAEECYELADALILAREHRRSE